MYLLGGVLMADITEPVRLGIVWLDVSACLYFQVLEDNTGVRRVVVTPHSECFPHSYSPALSPSHHIHPPYLTHPHFIPASHTSYYPPVSPGDVPPHQFYHHRLPPIYPEGKDSLSIAGLKFLVLLSYLNILQWGWATMTLYWIITLNQAQHENKIPHKSMKTQPIQRCIINEKFKHAWFLMVLRTFFLVFLL